MSIVKSIVLGLMSVSAKVLKGVGKGLEDGLEELGNIPAQIRFDRKERLSGRYVVDLDDGKTVTIKFYGGSFMWDYVEYCGKPLTDEQWMEIDEFEKTKLFLAINNWASRLFKRHGLSI